MAQKPSIPKGTRDFSPAEMVKRNYIFDTIKEVFRLYGFQPIETPAMENLSTLMGKYGEEGDKLLFKILNSGDFAGNVQDEVWTEKNSNKLTSKISEKGLRYDLTVPTARFVVQYQNEIVFPFKRYQIQPVWRADRPQKGRYREFYQCDVDVIGSNSLLNEVELVQIISDVFTRLKIETVVKINNRKILSGIAEVIGENSRIVDITVAIDKLDKIGLEKVNAELAEKGVSAEAIEKLQPILALKGNTAEKVSQLEQILATSEIGLKGVAEIKKLFGYLDNLQLNTEVELDLTLARGLNYYTGAIFEVKAKNAEMGSICGGGRYDDLTGIFGLPNVSGVGVSFGAERIYDVLLQANLFPQHSAETTKVLFVNFGEREEAYCLPVLAEIRKKGVNAEIFPDSAKMQKQMTYANRKNIPFVVLAGESEIRSEKFTLKNMETGEQTSVLPEELINILLQN
ncbi:MAG TPA: histidine--tRNA ligase [Prolixibacteraceae bacterium]|nr:histidine--tRNA ligase [Prolixibacteraceae bacterium]